MKKVITLVTLAFVLITVQAGLAQVNYTANDVITPYEGYYHPGMNLGYYGPEWNDNELADLAAGNQTIDVPGVGVRALRGSLPEGLGLTFTYDIWINKYNYNNAVGTSDNLLFLGFASEAHKDPVSYCSTNDIPTDMFANLYEPIWDDGENGTPVNDENYYALYVYEVVSRLKDHVKFWEIWNEPGFDFSGAKGFLQPGQPGNWWENNPDPCDYKLRAPIFHYIRTLRISYEVIKSIAPDDYVTVAGLGYDSFLDAVLRNTDNPDDGKVTAEYPLGGGAYFDVVGFHAYPHIDGSTRYWDNDLQAFVFTRHSDAAADALKVRTDARQEVLDRYGYDGVTYPKKEWIATEVNVPSTAFSQEWGSEEVQRNYVMKVNMKAMEMDYTQLHLFLLADLKTKEEANFEFDLMGMYESISDKVPYQQITKESGIGLKTMSDALFETRFDAARTAQMNLSDNIGGGAYLNEDGTYTYALWAKTQTDLSEQAFATYNFPASFGLTAMIRKEWNHSATGDRIAEGPGNIQLTGDPIFLRRLQDDPDIFLDVTCDIDIEIQVTATTPEGGQVVTWAEPTATTNCQGGVTIEQTQGIGNGDFFPFGVSEIQYTITNACGDVQYCAFNVAVASTGGGIGDCNLFRWEMGFVGQFEGNKYFVSKVKKDFAGAQAQCEGHGGYLVSIDSPRENEFIRQQVNDLAMIGYNDVAQEGELGWTSGKDVVFTNVADCQGCSNSDFGDVAMFNHFNGEWYFVGSDAVEYFIMELPCAEVLPCICTTEFDPVCAPDGTEYSNSCFAECAGVFDYTSCVSTCELSDLTWLDDLIEMSNCGNLDLEISSFESNGSTYVFVDDGSSVASDGGYVVYDCEGTLICTEAGFGLPLCTNIFDANFINTTTPYWIATEECTEPCILEDQVWYQELLADTTLCDDDTCFGSIESFDFGDSSYVAFIGSGQICSDFITEIYNCEQTLICTEGSIAGLTECSTLFGNDFPVNSEVIWSVDECPIPCVCTQEVFPVCGPDGTVYLNDCLAECEGVFDYGPCEITCDLDELTWLAELIDSTGCDNLNLVISSFESNGSTYVLIDDGTIPELDGGHEVYDCEGTLICKESGASLPCTDLFGADYTDSTTLYYSASEECPCVCDAEFDPVCGPDGTEYSNSCIAECAGVFDYGPCAVTCDLAELTWLADFIEEADCDNLNLVISSFESNGSTYILIDDGSSVASDGGYVVYDCEGTLICTEAGFGAELCTNIFAPDFIDTAVPHYVAAEECEAPCIIEDQVWLQNLVDSLDCTSCINKLFIMELDGIEYVYSEPDLSNSDCTEPFVTIYDCEGNIICQDTDDQNMQCQTLVETSTIGNVEVLWNKEEECEDCDIENLVWLQNKLDTLDCDDCISLLQVIEIDGVEHIFEVYDWQNFECQEERGVFVYDCEGNFVCQDLSDTNSNCDALLQPANLVFGETLWSKFEDCEQCDLENQVWLDSLLASPANCGNCISSIETYSYFDSEYIVVFGDDDNCADALTTGYRCDGTVLCYNGGIGGLTECDRLFGLGAQQEVLWERSVDCLLDAVQDIDITSLDLFPNPADQNVQLSFTTDYNMSLDYSLINIAGQVVLSGKYTATAGTNQINFELGDLASGMYFVRLRDLDSGSERSLKLVKN